MSIDKPRTRFARPPSVDDYARMSQQARLSAARLVEEQTRLIEQRRAALKVAGTQQVATLTRGAAQLIFDQLAPVEPDLALARQQVLYDATTTRRAAA
jgi:hypothetical protein